LLHAKQTILSDREYIAKDNAVGPSDFHYLLLRREEFLKGHYHENITFLEKMTYVYIENK